MKRLFYIIISFLPLLASAQQTLSLDECYRLSETNYPLAQQSVLLKEQSELEISAIEKAKLPQLDINAQATYQSDVTQFPIQQTGLTIAPPNKDQYRASLDVNQLIYKGGNINDQTSLKTAELETQQQQVLVNLYTLKSKINYLYFNILMLQEQRQLFFLKQERLQKQLNEINSAIKHGAVLAASGQVLEAEILKIQQQIIQIDFDRKNTLNKLSSIVMQPIAENVILTQPETTIASHTTSTRPEFKLFELQQQQIENSKAVIANENFPSIYGFAQADYGNPGLNMLENSFQDFYMVGVKLNWNVFDWGKTKERTQALDISQQIITTEKETFELNNNIELQQANSEIDKISALLETDLKIIQLQEKVVQAVASQLKNGVITSSEFLIEFNKLYESKINYELHKIQLGLAKATYKVTLGIPE